jgi:hypothetical protein
MSLLGCLLSVLFYRPQHRGVLVLVCLAVADGTVPSRSHILRGQVSIAGGKSGRMDKPFDGKYGPL